MCLEGKESREENGGIATENGGYLNSKITQDIWGETHYDPGFSEAGQAQGNCSLGCSVGLLAGNLNRAQVCSRILH